MSADKIENSADGRGKQPPGDAQAKRDGLIIAARGLAELRFALLDLHKALLDSERATYEKTVGPIQSPNHFLQLLIRDPWFAWLQPLSQLIVAMDEILDDKESQTIAGIDAVLKQTRLLLVGSETGDGFSKHYYDALQRDPAVVLAHATAAKRFGRRN